MNNYSYIGMVKDSEKIKLNKIFDATLRLTGNVGIAGLKMSHIAKEASIATGSLYINFKNKEELLNALYDKLQGESAPAIIKDIAHLPIHVQMYKMWAIALDRLVAANNRIIFLEQFVVSPFISEKNKQRNMDFKMYLKNLLDKGKVENNIKDVDTDMLITLIIGFLRKYSTHIVTEKNSNLTDTLIDESFNLCWNAIKA